MSIFILEEYPWYSDGRSYTEGYVTSYELARYWVDQAGNGTASERRYSELKCKDEELKNMKESSEENLDV